MRASTIILMVLVIDTLIFFGGQMLTDINSDYTPNEVGERPFTIIWDYNNATGLLDDSPNATFWGEIANLDLVGASMVVLSGSSIGINLANAIVGALAFFINILFAPFQIAQLTGLDEIWMVSELLTVVFLALHAFAIWKILSGRDV